MFRWFCCFTWFQLDDEGSVYWNLMRFMRKGLCNLSVEVFFFGKRVELVRSWTFCEQWIWKIFTKYCDFRVFSWKYLQIKRRVLLKVDFEAWELRNLKIEIHSQSWMKSLRLSVKVKWKEPWVESFLTFDPKVSWNSEIGCESGISFKYWLWNENIR